MEKKKITFDEFVQLLKSDNLDVIDHVQLNNLRKEIETVEEFYSYPIVHDNADCIRLNKRRGVVTTSFHNMENSLMDTFREKYTYEITL